jgi:signal transduction histidine kinase/ActR/RegA family two-component response regulator
MAARFPGFVVSHRLCYSSSETSQSQSHTAVVSRRARYALGQRQHTHFPASRHMSTKPALLRAEPHATVGGVLLRDAGVIVERWARRAVEEEASAKRVHHEVLLDHLPTFLWELGHGLADAQGADPFRHCRPADVHGDQRWEAGWSIAEVVRDYQLLRVVVVEHLDETLGHPLTTRESLAIGVFIDDAIAASVSAYTACQMAAHRPTDLQPARPGAARDELLGVLGVLGHELRNPMAPIGNALQILKVAATDPVAVERARALMERQLRLMTRLVDDLLDLPRLLRGKMGLKPERLDLSALVQNVVDDRRGAFDTAGITLTAEVPPRPLFTTGDAARLSQVFGNLLGNALKFTDRDGEVRVRLSADVTGKVAIFSVRDSGIGIDPAVLDRVFEPFVQADRSVDRSRGGLGLGLALVKGLVELHGGTVRASSAGAGTGTEVTVELPLIEIAAAAAGANEPTPAMPLSRQVLIIEDNEDSAESLKMYLELLGHEVAVAHSGSEGIRAAEAATPDVIVCDIGLPGMSGHAVCAHLRTLPALSRALFVALSGHAVDGPEGEVKGGGFDLYLLKPVDPKWLAEVLAGGTAAASGSQ